MNFDTPSFSSPSSSSGLGGDGKVDQELLTFIQQEKTKAEVQEKIYKLNDTCWDVCVDKPRDKLDSRTETCISNCVDRFIDVSFFVAEKFQKMMQKQM